MRISAIGQAFCPSNVKRTNSNFMNYYSTNGLTKDTVSFSAKSKDDPMAQRKSINDLGNIKGKRALVRVDINVPMDENKNITDDTRIRAIVPTVKNLSDRGAKVVLMAHLGRPKGKRNMEYSLEPTVERLSELLDKDVKFIPEAVGKDAEKAVKSMKNGDVALLENIRFYPEEEKNDPEFAKQLAKLGDFYVNDAFGAAHRGHASTAGVAEYLSPAVTGLLMEKEVNSLGKALTNPERPFTAIVGGSKISTKIGAVNNILDKMQEGDNLIIGGGMSYTFAKANGGSIGNSLCENDQLDTAIAIQEKAAQKGVNLLLPEDVMVTNDFSGNGTNIYAPVKNIPDGFEGVDAGPKTIEKFSKAIGNSKTILWNGPVGVFENDKFSNGTRAIAEKVAEITEKNGATTVLGGGDTVAAVKKFDMSDDLFSHVSTGGGASLEFIEGKVLPGVAALDLK